MLKNKYLYMPLALLALFFASCSQWDNFTTYFNTYYNMDRLVNESEDEFEYQDDKRKTNPRIVVPEERNDIKDDANRGIPAFVKDYVITQQQRQPVNVKLDSVIIKGSKILANHPKSDYVQGSLFLMAKSYFYRNEWLPSQLKCSELIDKFPDGEFSPDAHLLFSKNLIIQRKFYAGEIMLSRTVDIAWQLERYDILSEAFRLEAEVALFNDDLDGALRPYRQAVAQTDDGEIKANWQLDLAMLLYRLGLFERAVEEFTTVMDYSPGYLQEFEAKLYKAASLNRLGRYDDASEILSELENDGKFEEWKGYAFAERLNALRLQGKEEEMELAEYYADSAYVNNPLIVTYYFEKGMDVYEKDDYFQAAKYFARSRSVRTPVFHTSHQMYKLLTEYDRNMNLLRPAMKKIEGDEPVSDSLKYDAALYLFEIGRIHEQLDNPDSAKHYYSKSAELAPLGNELSARFLYAYARTVRDEDAYMADSLLEVIVERFPFSEYGRESAKQLGFTEDFVIDTVAELYKSGSELRKFGEYNFAITQFKKVYNEYPKSDYSPRSLYAIGWIFENNLHLPDSASYYYSLLIEKYPGSVYAEDVRVTRDYYLVVKSGETIPDSLKQPERVAITGKEDAESGMKSDKAPATEVKDAKMTDDPMEMIKDPSKIFKNAGDALKNPLNLLDSPAELIDEVKSADSPLNLLKPPDGKEEPVEAIPDSLETKPPN